MILSIDVEIHSNYSHAGFTGKNEGQESARNILL
jgi:hypothetical protein